MKNLLLCLAMALSVYSFGQSIDTTQLHIVRFVDQMTDKNYLVPSYSLICSPDGKKGFKITPLFDNRRGPASYDGLSVVSAGLGSCMENSELIFLFEDDTKVNTKSWNKFNCDGNSFFDYQKTLLDKLAKRVKAIRFTNGHGFDSYTHALPEEDRNYFINVKKAVEEQRVVDGGLIK